MPVGSLAATIIVPSSLGAGLKPMKQTVKTLLLLGSGLVLLSFGVVVVNQTAQVVMLARQVHPALGQATLWGLVISYAGFLGVPLVIVLRMPRALTPPASDSGPEFDAHLAELSAAGSAVQSPRRRRARGR